MNNIQSSLVIDDIGRPLISSIFIKLYLGDLVLPLFDHVLKFHGGSA
jgi:hypothetical protein